MGNRYVVYGTDKTQQFIELHTKAVLDLLSMCSILQSHERARRSVVDAHTQQAVP